MFLLQAFKKKVVRDLDYLKKVLVLKENLRTNL